MAEPGSGVTIAKWIEAHAQHRPSKPALIFNGISGEKRLTWLELYKNVKRLANVLRNAGITNDMKVAALLPNCVEMVDVVEMFTFSAC